MRQPLPRTAPLRIHLVARGQAVEAKLRGTKGSKQSFMGVHFKQESMVRIDNTILFKKDSLLSLSSGV